MKTGYIIAITILIASLCSGAGASLVMWKLLGSIKAGSLDAQTLSLSVCFIPIAISIIVALFCFRVMQPLLAKRLASSIGQGADGPPTVQNIASIPAANKTDRITPGETSQASSTKSRSGSDNAEDKMRLMIENAADVICLIDTNCTFLQVNAAANRVWGYRPEELVGKNLRDFLVNDSNVENTLNAIIGAEQSIAKITFENRFRKKNGRVEDMLWSAHWSISDGGLFCVAHNITERKRAEQAIRESEEKVRGILEDLPAAVALINRSGCLEFMNRAAFSMTGYKDDLDLSEIRAASLFSFCSEPFQMQQVSSLIERERSVFESLLTSSSGEHIPCDTSLSMISNRGEESCLVILMDARIKHELERTKREFVAMVSHDLKSPLSSILTVLAAFSDGRAGSLTEQGQAAAARAENECLRLIKLIQDLLDIERVNAGKFHIHVKETNIAETIASAVKAIEQLALLHDVKITVDVPPELICNCDGARIIQVLVNLLDNAIKFATPGSQLLVTANSEQGSTSISVSNQGRTIPQEKLSNIFEKFEQVEQSDASDKKGSGLGLAICKTLIEEHGGSIWATSADNSTCFIFTIPTKSNVAVEASTSEA